MKKVLFVGIILVIVISLLSSKAGLVAGSVYMVIWAAVLIMATRDYFFIRASCKSIEQAMDIKEKYLSEIKTAANEILIGRDKLKKLLEEFESLPEEEHEKVKNYIDALTKVQLMFEGMINYSERYQRRITLQSNALALFLARSSKPFIEAYQEREYPFHYQPSARVLEVINNQ